MGYLMINIDLLQVDLVAEHTVYAWTKYFEEQFPEISIVGFGCYPRDSEITDDTSTGFYYFVRLVHFVS
jgi:hypothetical protein